MNRYSMNCLYGFKVTNRHCSSAQKKKGALNMLAKESKA